MKGLILIAVGLLAFAGPASADDNWGLITGQYTVGATKTVAKDFGSMDILLSVNCAEKNADVEAAVADMVQKISGEIEASSNFSLKTTTPEIQRTSGNRYQMTYAEDDTNQLKPYFVDVCNGKSKVTVTAGTDLTKQYYRGSASLRIETSEDLAKLTELRQILKDTVEEYNKVHEMRTITVNKEQHTVSEDTQAQSYEELAEQSRLLERGEKQLTRLDVDRQATGGFSELYIESTDQVKNGSPSHLMYGPQLLDGGQSKVEVPYNFEVTFLPANLGQIKRSAYPEGQLGRLEYSFTGEAVVDTDYYVVTMSLTTGCQASEKAARDAMVDIYTDMRDRADKVVTQEDGNPYERMEERLGQAYEDNKWQAWEYVLEPSLGRDGRYSRIATSFINMCNGEVYKGRQLPKEKHMWAISHSLTLVTKDYNGLKSLQAYAASFTQKQRLGGNADRVEMSLGGIQPRLKDENHYSAVEVLAYKSALNQLLDPQGEVAGKLLDEIKAGEAYYSVTSGFPRADLVRGGARRAIGSDMEAAPAEPPAYKVIVTDDGNIPMAELRVDTTYSVRYRPMKDLVQMLQEARGPEVKRKN